MSDKRGGEPASGGLHTHGPDARSEEITRRLRSVEGHVRGVQRMVEEDAYCMDVVNQILAVQRALKKVSALVLDRHLHSCATSAIRGEDVAERERVLGEILGLFEASGRT
jgi:CsoR family transcriptional regulator, copper-sensing transcriptional repressor